MKKHIGNGIVLVVAALIFFAIGRNFYDKMGFEKNQIARGEMKVLLSQLQLGDSPVQVNGYVTSGNFQHLKLDSRSSSLWSVRTPWEFGSKNWTLYLEFDASAKLNAQAKLAAIRLRTPDGMNIPPHDIDFADRVRKNWQSPIDAEIWKRP